MNGIKILEFSFYYINKVRTYSDIVLAKEEVRAEYSIKEPTIKQRNNMTLKLTKMRKTNNIMK